MVIPYYDVYMYRLMPFREAIVVCPSDMKTT